MGPQRPLARDSFASSVIEAAWPKHCATDALTAPPVSSSVLEHPAATIVVAKAIVHHPYSSRRRRVILVLPSFTSSARGRTPTSATVPKARHAEGDRPKATRDFRTSLFRAIDTSGATTTSRRGTRSTAVSRTPSPPRWKNRPASYRESTGPIDENKRPGTRSTNNATS